MPVSSQYPLPGSSVQPRPAEFTAAAPSRVIEQTYSADNVVVQYRILEDGSPRILDDGNRRNLLA